MKRLAVLKHLRVIPGSIACLYSLLFCWNVSAQNTDSITNKLAQYFYALGNFSQHIPQEKVYLHFDNTSYYQGDNIWFKCYVVTSELCRPDELSKTLYVELLNPGGEIIDKRILKVDHGQCHGEFTLNRLPFYSGFYEVRAYTKYMLNFGGESIFTRLLPVFNKPKVEGDFAERSMLKYGYGKYPVLRKKPVKHKKVTLKVFPEGGNLVEGVTSQVAFEVTNAYGNPLEVTGAIVSEGKEEVSRFATSHEGRGVFAYTPANKKQKVVIDYNGKKYGFDLPGALPHGFVLTVDNLSNPDSIGVTLQKNLSTPSGKLGLVVINGGKVYNYCLLKVPDDGSVHFNLDKTKLPVGVSCIVLFDSSGQTLCDRMIFTGTYKCPAEIKIKTEKETYEPFDLVNMELTMKDKENLPVQTPFSLSVRDGMDEVYSGHTILADLLLMSEIKGYVRNPSYYFEADDAEHRTALDLLLRVQGWRRYSWKQMAGIEPFRLKYRPEQAIDLQGQVVSFVRQKPKPDVDLSLFLLKRGEEEEAAANFMDAFKTDSLGQFSVSADIHGKWNMILSVRKSGKKKDYRIILDRLFSPDPHQFEYADLQLPAGEADKAGAGDVKEPEDEMQEEDIETFYKTFTDSLAKAGNHEKIHRLKEVTVTAKKRSREKDIYHSRVNSVAYYDVNSERDDITDSGEYIGDDMDQFMLSVNRNFTPEPQLDFLKYKGKMPLFVINYETTYHTEMDLKKYKLLRLSAIKSVYISEDFSTIRRYADPKISPFDLLDLYGCAVLIETYPEGEIPAEPGKGVRKTWLEGYSRVKEFYSPDYSVLPFDTDYRRTLYWNPSVTPDGEGKARIHFYNNSRCRKFRISAETVTPAGIVGQYTDIH